MGRMATVPAPAVSDPGVRPLSVFPLLASLLLPTSFLRGADGTVPTAEARRAGTFTFYFENDWFGGTDRHYTNGTQFAWLSADLDEWSYTGWRRAFVRALPFVHRPGGLRNAGVAFGQNIYTPQDQEAYEPDPRDRPYAGWSYLEFSFLSRTEHLADVVAVQIGFVGRHSYAQDLQEVIHEWLNDSQANGWSHQLSDEFGLNLAYERKWRLFARAHDRLLGVDLVPHAGVTVGNVQTFANVGATLRLGFNLPSDFAVPVIRPGGGGTAPLDDHDPRVAGRWSFFVFGAGDGRAVARDLFLDGNTFASGPRVDRRRFVADLSYGAGVVAGKWQLTYTHVSRTREFETQRFPRNHFGSLAISRTL